MLFVQKEDGVFVIIILQMNIIFQKLKKMIIAKNLLAMKIKVDKILKTIDVGSKLL